MEESIFTHECMHACMFICNLCILQGVYIGGHMCICSCTYVQVYTIVYVCMHPRKKNTMYCMYACMYGHNVCMFYVVLTHYISHACIQTTHAQTQTRIHVNPRNYTPVYTCMLICVHTHLPANKQTHATNKNA